MKYRKKPVVIEALTFNEFIDYGKSHCNLLEMGMPWSFTFKGYNITHENDECYLIPTIESDIQKMTSQDMLIVGVKGEIYPCKLDVFEQTYERVED